MSVPTPAPGQTGARTSSFAATPAIAERPVDAAADEIISRFELGSTVVVAGVGGTVTLRSLLTAAIESDRNARAENALRIAESVVYANYGPEGDPEVFREAEALVTFSDEIRDVDAKTLLAAALSTDHLDADGIFAMLKEAAR